VSDTTNLRIPGPTTLPASVREAGSRQMVNHRGPEFKALLGRVTAGMQRGFRTSNDVLLLTASGTGGLEAIVVNFLSPADQVLSVSIGVFGDRLAAIATRYGVNVDKYAVEWGKAAEPVVVADRLRALAVAGTPAKAVLVTHNETSTGVTNPLQQIAAAIHAMAPDALIIVDGISGMGAVPFETDAWGLDIVATGSQKSWMVPPGMAMVSVSERAWTANETASIPRFYFDLKRARDAAAKGETPWTPAVGICFALDAALELIEAEGYDAIFARHAAVAAATRAGLTAMGFQLFADPDRASNTVTSAVVPEGVEWSSVSKELRGRGLVLAGGQGSLTGKIFRVGHLGDVHPDDIYRALETLEAGAVAQGLPVHQGVAVAAAKQAAAAVGSSSQELAAVGVSA
jgi:aspartate aminotransferase-like enzyme